MKEKLIENKTLILLMMCLFLIAAMIYVISDSQTYTIIYDSNGGEGEMADQTVKKEALVSLTPHTFTRSGYTFGGWSYGDELLEDRQVVSHLTTGAKVRLKAVWLPVTYKIVYHAHGGKGTMVSQEVSYGETVKLKKHAFHKTGYRFAGWSLSKQGTYVNFTDGTKVGNLASVQDAQVDLYAVWQFDEAYAKKHITIKDELLSTTTGNALMLTMKNPTNLDTRAIITFTLYDAAHQQLETATDVVTLLAKKSVAAWTSPHKKAKHITYEVAFSEAVGHPKLSYRILSKKKKRLKIRVTNHGEVTENAVQARLVGYRDAETFFFEQQYSTSPLAPGETIDFTFHYYRDGIAYTIYLQ